jgi:adenine-specific DNA-methyltransferase
VAAPDLPTKRVRRILSASADTLLADSAGVVPTSPRVADGALEGASLGTADLRSVTSALTARTEERRLQVLATLPGEDQARLGQFFTPDRAAALIADLPRLPATGRLRVLDPGAGVGSLSVALAARVLLTSPALELEIVAVELDADVAASLRETLADVERVLRNAGRQIATQVVIGDYIELTTGGFMREPVLDEPFDLVIMNPPYRKLPSASRYRHALARLGADCPNLYAAFLALGCKALDEGGQLVAITPRSFANGPYFGQFRRFLLDRLALDRIHVFESRSTVFSDTGVLQENVVFSGTCGGKREKVKLSASRGHTDDPLERVVDYGDVVRPGDTHRFIRILAGEGDTAVAETMAALPAMLADLQVQVSTGRVVDFRSRPSLTEQQETNGFPLVYPGNLRGGVIEWPRQIRKAQGFSPRSESDQKLLMPAGFYVVVKRFSAKEERRRVVAAVWDPGLTEAAAVAFENHLNVFHAQGAGLDRDLAVGLSYWLNSSIADTFFRTFSGHTQVNATDLRTLRFPTASALRTLGHGREALLPSQTEIDRLTTDVLGVRGVAA